jgi:uncharacterized protein (DUF2252 family)
MAISNKLNGKELRKKISRSAQSDFKCYPKRHSVLNMIQASNYDRVKELIPIRHARMSVSPFTFYRGTANIMASDLANLQHTNIKVQAIGDCHLMNFGGFATPERTLVFDANDFDETHPAPWEWDVKRLATSFVLAARNNGLKNGDGAAMAFALAQSYREHVLEFAKIPLLDLWYMKFDIETMRNNTKNIAVKHLLDDALAQVKKQSEQKELYKTIRNDAGNYEIINHPPLVYHTKDLVEHKKMAHSFIQQYLKTLQADRRYLVEQYKIVDVALKVVGVGSVGTRCYVALLMNEKNEPLFIQMKEARESVLEPYTSKSIYTHQGERVVQGQRLVQTASDIFLGWSTAVEGRHFYIRQLRDKKISPDVDKFNKEVLYAYARLCGRMLARAHAKTSNTKLLSEYMGKGEVLDDAISKFAVAYANQTEKDYDAFMKAIKAGKLPIEKIDKD